MCVRARRILFCCELTRANDKEGRGDGVGLRGTCAVVPCVVSFPTSLHFFSPSLALSALYFHFLAVQPPAPQPHPLIRPPRYHRRNPYRQRRYSGQDGPAVGGHEAKDAQRLCRDCDGQVRGGPKPGP